MWKLSEGELDRGEEIKFKSRGKSRWKGPETWKYLGIVLSGLERRERKPTSDDLDTECYWV